MPSKQEVTAMATRQPSAAAVAAANRSADAARLNAQTERRKRQEAEASEKLAKKQNNARLKEQAKQWLKFLSLLGLAVAGGLSLGGQLTRVTAKWGRYVQYAALGLGFLALLFARKRWHALFGIGLLSAGGVVISDMSRMYDWIPGDQTWENTIPDGDVEVQVVKKK